jgi:predicted nucleic acid-binding protein
MVRMVLLDANMLIGALDGEEGNPANEANRARFLQLLEDDEVRLAVSPLITYEFLRGLKKVSLEEIEAVLNDFQKFDIKEEHARLAAEVFRIAKDQGSAIHKKNFDIFHCVCAELHQLEMESQDADIVRIQKLIKAVK